LRLSLFMAASDSEILNLFLHSTGVSIDTRTLKVGNLFFALKGDRFDGHLFIQTALEKGASGVIFQEEFLLPEPDPRCIGVPDTLITLQNLAGQYRNRLNIPILAIGGSNGKTTTKELCKAVLSNRFRTFATAGNLNNHIGVPISILSIPKDTEVAVIEIGANHLGEHLEILKYLNPTHVLVTNNGLDHLEGFGGIAGVIKANAEIFEYAESIPRRVAFINNDDEQIKKYPFSGTQAIRYSIVSDNAEISGQAEKVSFDGMMLSISIKGKGTFEITSEITGIYNVHNILAAVAVGTSLGCSIEDIKKGISGYMPDNNRSQVIQKGNRFILLDAYNANPSSMEASVKSIVSMDPDAVLMLGDMFELGDSSVEMHRVLGLLLNQLKVKSVVFIGQEMRNAWEAFVGKKYLYDTMEEAIDKIPEWSTILENEKTILIKGSRGMAMERLEPLIPILE